MNNEFENNSAVPENQEINAENTADTTRDIYSNSNAKDQNISDTQPQQMENADIPQQPSFGQDQTEYTGSQSVFHEQYQAGYSNGQPPIQPQVNQNAAQPYDGYGSNQQYDQQYSQANTVPNGYGQNYNSYGYQQGAYGYQPVQIMQPEQPPRNGVATASMVIGIVSLVIWLTSLCCCFPSVLTLITSIIGLVLAIMCFSAGNKKGAALTGLITNGIAFALSLATVIIFVIILASPSTNIDFYSYYPYM